MSDSEEAVQILPGGIRLDRRAGEVCKNGLKIVIPEQLVRLLSLLGEHPGEVVTREEIRNNLWSNTYVNFNDSINSAIRRLRNYLGERTGSPQLIETLPGHGYRLILPASRPNSVTTFPDSRQLQTNPNIAVLPFENLSGNPAEDCMADCLTDAIITELAKIRGLCVKPRCTVMAYKHARPRLATIGRKLKVSMVLQGSLVHFDDRLRITAQLLSVELEEHVWTESYSCKTSDVLAFQTEVAERITRQIAQKLVPAWKPRGSYISPVRVAHDSFLKAHDYFETFTNDGFWKARQYWKKAVRQDPSYPQAYAGLAETYNMLGMTGLLESGDAMEEARGAAKTALKIDDSLAGGHSALAQTYAVEWQWHAAEREFNSALELDPVLTDSNPCHYVEFLLAVKGPKQTIMEIERLCAAQPSSGFLGLMLGWAHYANHDYDSAVREHQDIIRRNPKHTLAHLLLALDLSQKQEHATAIEECYRVLALGKTRLALNALGYIYAAAGDKGRAKEILIHLRRLQRTSFASPYAFAAIYAGLGETHAAFDFLERAYESHDPELTWLRWDPQLDNLRSDYRYQSLLNRIGLQALPRKSYSETNQLADIEVSSA
ncbi:MAG TPA: winged helix-turn-helix domain-containing protein [Candidatus Acidoferrales bacterium]|jgi:TolB-like protein/Tfp pilus assembly protein PilF|nr:winged helix-turn-helix domain-containing protein [Candidatus Acidoferrales bacterium]